MKLIKWFFILLFLLTLSLLAAPFVLLYLGLENEARVAPVASAGAADIAHLKALLKEHDPRDLPDGASREVTLPQRSLNLGLGALPFADRQTVRAAFVPGSAHLQYTVRLPANPLGDYFNASVMLAEEAGELRIEEAQFGDVTLSGLWFAPALYVADSMLRQRMPEYAGARDALRAVYFEQGGARFVYQWDQALAAELQQRGRDVMLPARDREAIAAYYSEVVRVAAEAQRGTSLAELLAALFALAQQRSDTGSAANENRALLLVLGLVMQGASPTWLVGEDTAASWTTPARVGWTLQGRTDLAQHFGISAALSVGGGSALADAVGVFKELDDSRGGTGFSFADLLADRAGVELGVYATSDRAGTAQQRMAHTASSEDSFMPRIDRLPEGLMEMKFVQRYSDLDDARYARVKDQIERRIAGLPLYRP